MPSRRGAVAWRTWSHEAFSRAHADDRPILLSLVTTWSHWCHEMDRAAYADPAVVAILNDKFVTIRVDADLRPDINERYNLGGWPTTAFLSPDGALLGGGTYVDADRLRTVLERVADVVRSRKDEIERARAAAAARHDAGRPREGAAPDREAVAWVTDRLVEAFDLEFGGFGAEPKFPHLEAVSFALECHRRDNDARLADMASRSLDAMGWSGLYDEIDGGFFHYSTSRDWRLPHTEKLLEANARFIGTYLDAWEALEHAPYLERAADCVRFVQSTLFDEEAGRFFSSQREHSPYYRLDAAGRQQVAPPPVDRAEYVGPGALMAGAFFRAAAALQAPGLAERAAAALDRLLLEAYRPGAGVAHSVPPAPPVGGLLGDQIQVTAALLEAHAVTGAVAYADLAQEILLTSLRTMWDERAGGFFDRRPTDQGGEFGLLRETRKPFLLNCEAARLLLRVSELADEPAYRQRAVEVLAALAPVVRERGLAAAAYALGILALDAA